MSLIDRDYFKKKTKTLKKKEPEKKSTPQTMKLQFQRNVKH